jgi:hypothetical protein
MAKIIKRRRGSTTDHASFTGAEGELTIDLTKDTVIVHDASTAGGFPLAREDMSNVTGTVGLQQLNFSDGITGQFLSTNGGGTLSFETIDVSAATVGGDLSGTVANAQIGGNTVGIPELNINGGDGTNGQVLTTNGSGVLSFTSETNVSTSSVGGDITGTIGNAQIVSSAVGSTELASNSVTTIKILDSNVTVAKLASDSVTTAKILDANVTDAKISGMTSSKLSGNLPALNGSALTNLPYDMGFIAGYDKDLLKENVEVATYGEIVMARTGTFVGESGFSDTAPTGSALIVDILKNGTTIYSTKPQFAISAQTMTAGTISSGSFVAGDRITFKITQIGSSANGQGVRFTLRGAV